MGKGAKLTIINQTDLQLSFGTSDREFCWKDEHLDKVHGDIPSGGQSAEFYIEGSSNSMNGCAMKTASVKIKVEEKEHSDRHFANVTIMQDRTRYTETGRHVNNLHADSVISYGDQDQVDVYVTKTYNKSRWITDLIPQDRMISNINIPGTHDSGTFAEIIADFDGITGKLPIDKHQFAKCQDNTIKDQLEQGIRFLDIRLASIKNIKEKSTAFTAGGAALKMFAGDEFDEVLHIVHGKILYNYTFNMVLNDCEAFLKANPGEFIIMSVKPDDFGFDEAIWAKTYDQHQLFYHGCQWPTVADAKGKIVLLRRFDSDQYRGYDLNVSNNEESRKIKNCTVHPGCTNTYKYTTQDDYDINLEQQYLKQGKVNSFIEDHQKSDPDLLLLNFISYVGKYSSAMTAWNDVPYPREAAWRMMHWLQQELIRRGKIRYGILSMDFPQQAVINTLIHSNKK